MTCDYCQFDRTELTAEIEELTGKVTRLQNMLISSDRIARESEQRLKMMTAVPILGEVEFMRKKLQDLYRRKKRSLASVEKKLIQFGTQDLEVECSELRGFLKGVDHSIAALECRAVDNEFPEFRAEVTAP